MSVARLIDWGRRSASVASLMLVLLLAGASLLRHLADDTSATRASIARYQRIAADLPRLEAASRSRPAAEPAARVAGDPSIEAALWQSQLSRLASAQGLQLASAEPLLADRPAGTKPSIALELVGPTAGLLSFVYEIERGASAMTIARLEITPAGQADANSAVPAEKLLRIRLQAVPSSAAP